MDDESTLIVNGSTGEVITTLGEGDRLRVIREGSLKAYSKMKTVSGRYDIHKGDSFVKVYNQPISELLKEDLSAVEMKLIFSAIACSNKFGSGELTYINYIKVSAEALFDMANVSRNHGYNALSRLIKKGVLAKVKVNKKIVYFGNPFIFSKGNEVEANVLDLFKDTKWAYFNKEAR